MSEQSELLSARQVADRLGIKLETVYAYASRGLLRSLPVEGRRARRYLAADVEQLEHRRTLRSREDADDALDFGRPVMDSAVTRLTPEGPLYRGQAAVALAQAHVPFESVAELLWTGVLPPEPPFWPAIELGTDLAALRALIPRGTPPLSALAAALPALAIADQGRWDPRPAAVLARGRELIPRLAASLALCSDPARVEPALTAGRVSAVLATALGLRHRRPVLERLDQALVLVADHELNASTFAARVAASTRADPYACLAAGIGTLSGPLHGSSSEQVGRLLAEIGTPERAEAALFDRMRRGEPLPGCGHAIYSSGDPRAPVLIASALSHAPEDPPGQVVEALLRVAAAAGLPAPNVDLGIASLVAVLGLPPAAGPGLFAIGRCAGWLAHVLEHYERGGLVRPRARYPAAG